MVFMGITSCHFYSHVKNVKRSYSETIVMMISWYCICLAGGTCSADISYINKNYWLDIYEILKKQCDSFQNR